MARLTLPSWSLLFSIRVLARRAMTVACFLQHRCRIWIAEDGPGDRAGQALVAVFLAGAEDHRPGDDLIAAAGRAAVPFVTAGHAASPSRRSRTTFPSAWLAGGAAWVARAWAAHPARWMISSSVR